MTPEQRAIFDREYSRKKRATGGMIVLAILFPIQLFLLGRTGLGIAFILTVGGGSIWWIIEWFLTPSRVRTYNEEVAMQIVRDLKTI